MSSVAKTIKYKQAKSNSCKQYQAQFVIAGSSPVGHPIFKIAFKINGFVKNEEE